MKKILLILLLTPCFLYAADTKVSDLAENTTVADSDLLYIIDAGTTSEKITVINLFDTIDTSAKLWSIVTDETGTGLLSFATSPVFTTNIRAAAQADIGTTAAEFGNIYLGDSTVIYFGDDQDVTLTHTPDTKLAINLEFEVGGILDAHGIVTLGDGGDNFSVASDGIDIDTLGNITNVGTIASGVITVTGLLNTSVGLDAVGAVDLDYGSADVTDHTFVSDGGTAVIDGSITAVTAFIIGAANMSEADLETIDGITPGTAAASKALVLDSNLDIATINNLTATALIGALTGNADTATLATTITVADNEATAETNAILFSPGGDLDGGNYTPESDGDLTYTPNTGTLDATEFTGGGAGLTSVDAITGDSATAFFDAGTIEHERGGLESDVSSFSGLVAIAGGSTVEVDAKSELETQIADVSDFAEADGDTYTNAHDFGGATSIEIPNSTDPDVDAAGEISNDTDGANEAPGGNTDVIIRAYDGSNQWPVGQKLRTLNFTLISPSDIAAADLIPIWHNTTGMVFTIVEWKAWSDTDDVSLEIEELTDPADYTARTTVDAVEIATNGTGVFYASDTTITHATIENDSSIAIDFDTADTPEYVQMAITGWFNSDID